MLGGGSLSYAYTSLRLELTAHPGGYNSPNVARAWTYLTSIVVGACPATFVLHGLMALLQQLEQPLSLDADIPDHGAFPLYAPSFTLNVPAGTIQDRNTDSYLSRVEDVFDQVVHAIHDRMQSATGPR